VVYVWVGLFFLTCLFSWWGWDGSGIWGVFGVASSVCLGCVCLLCGACVVVGLEVRFICG